MFGSARRDRERHVFLDVCTQRDYLDPAGACPALNAGYVLPRIKHLMAFARWARVGTISCVDAQRPDEARGRHEAACVLGTLGQRKLSYTVLPDHVVIDSDNCLCVPLDVLDRHQQAILIKEHRDPFTNPKLDRLLTESPGRRFVVFGVALETTIRLLALGLLLRHRSVTVIRDASAWWNAEDGEMALRHMSAKGCDVVTTQQYLENAVRARQNGRLARAFRRRFVA